jgi:hypothetical protein
VVLLGGQDVTIACATIRRAFFLTVWQILGRQVLASNVSWANALSRPLTRLCDDFSVRVCGGIGIHTINQPVTAAGCLITKIAGAHAGCAWQYHHMEPLGQ